MCSIFSRIHIQISHKILLDIFFSTYTRNTSHTFFYLIIITSIERYRENRNREHHGKRSDTRPDQVANRIILPSSFQGRAINKGKNFQDAMTACHLDLIVSFTCNNVEEMVPCSKTTGSNWWDTRKLHYTVGETFQVVIRSLSGMLLLNYLHVN